MVSSGDTKMMASKLRKLRESSPITREGLDAWNHESREFSDWFVSEFEVQLPAQVMHYLHDADLRVKDSEYAEMQDDSIRHAIAELEMGRMPESDGVTVTISPKWLVGSLGAALLGFILVMFFLFA